MEYVGSLIRRVRRDSQSMVFHKNVGVVSQQIVDFLNEGLRDLVAKISIQNSLFFQKEIDFDLVRNGTVDIRGSLSYDAKIIAVQSITSEGHVFNIPNRDIREVRPGNGVAYAVQNGELVIEGQEIVTSVRVIYEERLPNYAERAAVILDGTGLDGKLIAITVGFLDLFTADDFNNAGDLYFTAIDKDGTILMRNVPYVSCSSLGAFTIFPYAYEKGEVINVGNFIAIGMGNTTHVNLSKEHQDYVVAYATSSVMGVKGASFETQTFLKKRREDLLATILETHSDPVKDYNNINVVDNTLLGF